MTKHIIPFLSALFFLYPISTCFGAIAGINNGGCSFNTIQQAIDAASSGDSIQIYVGTYFENLDIDSKNLTIRGGYDSSCTTPSSGIGITTIDGVTGSVIKIDQSTTQLRDLDITGGTSATLGGGISITNGSIVSLSKTFVADNSATFGGGVYVSENSSLTISGSKFNYNSASTSGGAGYIQGALTTTGGRSVFGMNDAPNGGGLLVAGGSINLINCSVLNNKATGATGKGGAIYAAGSTVIIDSGSEIEGSTGYDGSGIYGSGSTIQIDNSNLSANEADNYGGGMYVVDSTINISNESYIGNDDRLGSPNKADNGGGIYADNSTITLTHSHVSKNTSTILGGGIYLRNNSILNSTSSAFGFAGENRSGSGGSIYAQSSTINLNNSALFAGYATSQGGAIALAAGSTLNAINPYIVENYADSNGGAIFSTGSTINIDVDFNTRNPYANLHSLILENGADADSNNTGSGGAIYALSTSLNINHTYFALNTGRTGGAIYLNGTGQVSNSLFFDNSVTGTSGAAINVSSTNFKLSNSTLTSNTGAPVYSYSGSGTHIITASIAWGNTGGGFSGTTTSATCNIDQSGANGIIIDPLFVAPGSNGNYRLQSGSPAIDICSSGEDNDIENNRRPIHSMYDAGAYEYGTYFPWSLYLPAIIK